MRKKSDSLKFLRGERRGPPSPLFEHTEFERSVTSGSDEDKTKKNLFETIAGRVRSASIGSRHEPARPNFDVSALIGQPPSAPEPTKPPPPPTAPAKRVVPPSPLQPTDLLATLPDAVVQRVLLLLSPHDLRALCQTCGYWRFVLEDHMVWQGLFAAFNRPITLIQNLKESNHVTWKDLFSQHFMLGVTVEESMKFVRLFPKTPDYEHDKTDLLIKIATYYKNTNQVDRYIDIVQELCNYHVQLGNKVEGGMCQLSMATVIDSNEFPQNRIVPPLGHHPLETLWTRKTRFVLKSVELLSEGKYWEKSIILLKQLRAMYESIQDYSQLSIISQLESANWMSIATKDRFFEEYFFVQFHGKGLPAALTEQAFIYRGAEVEKLGGFVAKMKSRFPGAQIIHSHEIPPVGKGQYIHIRPCKPIKRLPTKIAIAHNITDNPAKIVGPNRPEQMERFYENDSVHLFLYMRPFKKEPKKKSENEFKDLWIQKTYIFTKDTFPTIQRRSIIVKEVIYEAPPIENANQTIKDKNAQLRSLVDRTARSREWSSQFTMALNGVIDAAVSGGVAQLSSIFLSEEYAAQNPQDLAKADKLRTHLQKQASILGEGLTLHKQIMPAKMLGLHQKLESFFFRFKRDAKLDTSEVISPQSDTGDQYSSLSSIPNFPNTINTANLLELSVEVQNLSTAQQLLPAPVDNKRISPSRGLKETSLLKSLMKASVPQQLRASLGRGGSASDVYSSEDEGNSSEGGGISRTNAEHSEDESPASQEQRAILLQASQRGTAKSYDQEENLSSYEKTQETTETKPQPLRIQTHQSATSEVDSEISFMIANEHEDEEEEGPEGRNVKAALRRSTDSFPGDLSRDLGLVEPQSPVMQSRLARTHSSADDRLALASLKASMDVKELGTVQEVTTSPGYVSCVVVCQSAVRRLLAKKLHQKLASAFKQRTNVVEEIYETEKKYVQDLLVIINSFLQPIKDSKLVATTTIWKIFAEIELIADINSMLLAQIEQRFKHYWSPQTTIGDVFLERAEDLKYYTNYVTNYEDALATLAKSRSESKAVNALITACEKKPECEKRDLNTFLIIPMQRIVRYIMLLEGCLKATNPESADYLKLTEAIEAIRTITKNINEKKRELDNVKKVAEVEERLSGKFEFPSSPVPRAFLKEGFLLEKAGIMSRSHYVFLFNDLILFTAPKKNKYRITHAEALCNMKVGTTGEQEIVEIKSLQKSWVLYGKDKEEWATAIAAAVPNAPVLTTPVLGGLSPLPSFDSSPVLERQDSLRSLFGSDSEKSSAGNTTSSRQFSSIFGKLLRRTPSTFASATPENLLETKLKLQLLLSHQPPRQELVDKHVIVEEKDENNMQARQDALFDLLEQRPPPEKLSQRNILLAPLDVTMPARSLTPRSHTSTPRSRSVTPREPREHATGGDVSGSDLSDSSTVVPTEDTQEATQQQQQAGADFPSRSRSSSFTNARSATSRVGTPRAATPRTGTPRAGTPRSHSSTPRVGTPRNVTPAGTPRLLSFSSSSAVAGSDVFENQLITRLTRTHSDPTLATASPTTSPKSKTTFQSFSAASSPLPTTATATATATPVVEPELANVSEETSTFEQLPEIVSNSPAITTDATTPSPLTSVPAQGTLTSPGTSPTPQHKLVVTGSWLTSPQQARKVKRVVVVVTKGTSTALSTPGSPTPKLKVSRAWLAAPATQQNGTTATTTSETQNVVHIKKVQRRPSSAQGGESPRTVVQHKPRPSTVEGSPAKRKVSRGTEVSSAEPKATVKTPTNHNNANNNNNNNDDDNNNYKTKSNTNHNTRTVKNTKPRQLPVQ